MARPPHVEGRDAARGIDPRWVALLLMPVLVLAGALRPQAPPAAVSAAAGADAGEQTAVERTFGVTTHLAFAPQPVWQTPLGDVPVAHAARRRHGAPRSDRGRDDIGRRPLTPEARGEAALAALDYDWRALGYRVRFRPYEGGALGTANRRTKLITVYVRRGQSELSLRTTIAHELAHALDFEHGTAERRGVYRRIRSLPSDLPWFPCSRCEDYASPAGDFAEVFAVWLVGPDDFRSRLAGPPGYAQLREVTPLFQVPRAAPRMRAAAPAPSPTPSRDPQDEQGPLPDLLPPPSPLSGR